MSWELIKNLLCDARIPEWGQCSDEVRIHLGETIADARARAAKAGWTHPARNVDYCPKHKQKGGS